MKTDTYTETESHLEVTGTLWCGQPDTAHSYPLRGLPLPKTMAEAKSIAGDFSELEIAEVVTVTREIRETRDITNL